MEVRAVFGRFVWRGVNIDDVTIHPSRGSRINPTLKQDSTTGEFRFSIFHVPTFLKLLLTCFNIVPFNSLQTEESRQSI